VPPAAAPFRGADGPEPGRVGRRRSSPARTAASDRDQHPRPVQQNQAGLQTLLNKCDKLSITRPGVTTQPRQREDW